MAITIRLPSDSTLPSYHYRPRSVPLHTRLYRRIIPLTILLVLLLETLRFLRTPTAPPLPYTSPPASRPETPPGKGLRNLVLVAAHGIWSPEEEGGKGGWVGVQEYQRGQEETWVQHINRSVEIAREDEAALLVFSGGETKREAGARSEGLSYFELAKHHGFINGTEDPLWDRTTTETFALDSYQNLAYSVCRFCEFAGSYPGKITVVGYEFKRGRFEKLHKTAMGWGEERGWEYVGIDPDWEGIGEGEETAAKMGEMRVRGEWERCEEALEGKRRGRNWGARGGGYGEVCPEMGEVWSGCGVGEVRWG